MKTITLDTVVKKNEDIFTGSIDDEMVAMSIESGKYYKLNKTGSHILALLDQPRSVRDICNEIQGRYSFDDGGLREEEVLEFIRRIAKNNLIKVI